MKRYVKWGILVPTILLLCAAGNYGFPGCTTTCFENGECREKEFCRHPDGACDDEGICENRPIGCPKNLDPVCGCDGMTYDNDCFAAMAGVSVDYEGECIPEECLENEECGEDFYCHTPDGECDGAGICEEMPDPGCPEYYDPVCGCDGLNYDNRYFAAAAGVSVAYEGLCEPDVCATDIECDDAGFFCRFEIGACTGPGLCTWMPEMCPMYYAPICGCDGVTYGNTCFADGAGASIAHIGECP